MTPASAAPVPPTMTSRVKSALRTRFARDAAFLQVAAGVNTVSGFLTSIVVFRLFGAVGYGGYAEALNLYALIFFLGNVGLGQVTVARIAEAGGRADAEGIGRWLGIFLRAFVFVSLGLALLGVAIGPVIGERLQHDRTVGVWAALLCLSGPITAPFALVQCALQGTRRMRLLAQMENLKELARTVLVVAGALSFGGPLGAVLGEVAAAAFSIPLAAITYVQARREPGPALPSARELLGFARRVSVTELRRGLADGFRITLRKNLTVIIPTILPRLFLGYFGSAKEVGFYTLAQNLMKMPMLAAAGISRAMMPALGQLRGSGDVGAMKKQLAKLTVVAGVGISIVAAAFTASLYWAIPAFYGESARGALALVPWFLVATALSSFAVGVEAFYLVAEKLSVAVRIDVITAIVSTAIGIWLVAWFHAPGAAAYSTLATGGLAAHFVYISRYFRAFTPTPQARHLR